MKTIELIIICGMVLAAPAALLAAEEKPAETVTVSSAASPATIVGAPVGLVKGYRGTAIPVGGDQLLYVKKGDRVDVLVTFEAKMEKNRKETLTSTILQNVIVINVSKPEKVDDQGAIELLLNPVEAQYAALSVAQAKNINISVRSIGDTELHPMEMASFRKLIK
ncbi:MAG: RcpC/CpaB family pilus assembly protein [Elusimicrobia bacterium]|nr:RcpC/CpaB family pilus assembly protein [Elusimicrobiota bacterium]